MLSMKSYATRSGCTVWRFIKPTPERLKRWISSFSLHRAASGARSAAPRTNQRRAAAASARRAPSRPRSSSAGFTYSRARRSDAIRRHARGRSASGCPVRRRGARGEHRYARARWSRPTADFRFGRRRSRATSTPDMDRSGRPCRTAPCRARARTSCTTRSLRRTRAAACAPARAARAPARPAARPRPPGQRATPPLRAQPNMPPARRRSTRPRRCARGRRARARGAAGRERSERDRRDHEREHRDVAHGGEQQHRERRRDEPVAQRRAHAERREDHEQRQRAEHERRARHAGRRPLADRGANGTREQSGGVTRKIDTQRRRERRGTARDGERGAARHVARPAPVAQQRRDREQTGDRRRQEHARVHVRPRDRRGHGRPRPRTVDLQQPHHGGQAQPAQDLRARAERLDHRQRAHDHGGGRQGARDAAAPAAQHHRHERGRRRGRARERDQPRRAVLGAERERGGEQPLVRRPRRAVRGERLGPQRARDRVLAQDPRAEPALPQQVAVAGRKAHGDRREPREHRADGRPRQHAIGIERGAQPHHDAVIGTAAARRCALRPRSASPYATRTIAARPQAMPSSVGRAATAS